MKSIREGLTIAVFLFLGLGYAASQLAYHQGRAHEYAIQIDQRPVHLLALILLLSCIGVGILSRKEEEPES